VCRCYLAGAEFYGRIIEGGETTETIFNNVNQLLLCIRFELYLCQPQSRRYSLQKPLVKVHRVGNADNNLSLSEMKP
jgi:hypothetical protein